MLTGLHLDERMYVFMNNSRKKNFAFYIYCNNLDRLRSIRRIQYNNQFVTIHNTSQSPSYNPPQYPSYNAPLQGLGSYYRRLGMGDEDEDQTQDASTGNPDVVLAAEVAHLVDEEDILKDYFSPYDEDN